MAAAAVRDTRGLLKKAFLDKIVMECLVVDLLKQKLGAKERKIGMGL